MTQVQLRVLSKSRKQRTPEDINSLLPSLKTNHFFKERDFDEESMLKILANASFETVEEGQYVFKRGEIGDKFYLVLHGSVGVHIQNPQWKLLKREKRTLKRKILDNVKKLDDLLLIKKRNDEEEDEIIFSHHELLKNRLLLVKKKLFMKSFNKNKEVTVLGEGRSFGELALMNNEPR